MMNAQAETWSQVDWHADYELFEDFNAWIDEGEIDLGLPLLRGLGQVGLSNPSKAFSQRIARRMNRPYNAFGPAVATKCCAASSSKKPVH